MSFDPFGFSGFSYGGPSSPRTKSALVLAVNEVSCCSACTGPPQFGGAFPGWAPEQHCVRVMSVKLEWRCFLSRTWHVPCSSSGLTFLCAMVLCCVVCVLLQVGEAQQVDAGDSNAAAAGTPSVPTSDEHKVGEE